MKPRCKDDPKEWRKAGWMGALGLAIFTGLLCWRRILPLRAWEVVLCLLAAAAFAAAVRPRLFRGFYRFSNRLGMALAEVAGRVALAFIFIVVVTPLALLLRITGKDPLRLRRQPGATSYWTPARPQTPLDHLF